MYIPDEPVWAALETYLDDWQSQRRNEYLPPETEEEARLENAIRHFAGRALELVYNPSQVAEILDKDLIAEPWEDVEGAVFRLVGYQVVHEELEADAAFEVIGRLQGLRDRLRVALLALLLLQKADPSDTALKYLRQVIRLYLAGFEGEVAIMARAVLEAAIRDRIPNELLIDLDKKPQYKRTGDFSLRQRMDVASEVGVLPPEARDLCWDVINWGNDAVHVQYDAVPDPTQIVIRTAHLLGEIHRGNTSGGD